MSEGFENRATPETNENFENQAENIANFKEEAQKRYDSLAENENIDEEDLPELEEEVDAMEEAEEALAELLEGLGIPLSVLANANENKETPIPFSNQAIQQTAKAVFANINPKQFKPNRKNTPSDETALIAQIEEKGFDSLDPASLIPAKFANQLS